MELEGTKLGGRNLNNIMYADVTVLIADSEVKLQRLVQALVQVLGERGLIPKNLQDLINGNEETRTRFEVNEDELEHVSRNMCLSYIVTRDGRYVEEIRNRISIGKTALNRVKSLVTNR